VALPLLQGMKKNLRGTPKASLASLERLLTATPTASPLPSLHLPNPFLLLSASSFQLPASNSIHHRRQSLRYERQWSVRYERQWSHCQAGRTQEQILLYPLSHLVASRTQVVYGVGSPFAELLFVGEAPGEEEDLRGEPFVGKAGQLLTKIIVP